jgi:nitrite reductase/ring-hydroxylating ferredoxin subunit
MGYLLDLSDGHGGTVPVVVVALEAGGGRAFSAFVNRCPHARWPLDRFDGTFLFTPVGDLVCAAHGASFDALTGHCLAGPGTGAPLTVVPVAEDGNWLLVGPLPDCVDQSSRSS